ncbi:hypothetical protein R6Z07F_000153 [Ovis aries]
MAPPAPGSSAGPASCDVTGPRHHPAEGGKPEEDRSGSPLACPAWDAPWPPPGGGGPRTMAAAHDLEIEEDVTLNMDREMKEELEEEKMREGRADKDPFKPRKVHRIVSKWMLPEPVRRTYLERANCLPPPVFIICVSIAELAVFIYYAVWKPQKQWITLDTGILKSPFIYRPEKREEAWRFISYMLVHAGVQHILGNLIMQLSLGIPLEMVHKGLRVGLVYLAGVIAGSLASSIFDPLKSLVGASGGVYALMGGYFMNVLVNFQEMIPAFGVVRLLIIIVIIVSDMGFALYRRFFVPANGSPVSFAAHIAGGFAGMSIGYTVFSCFDQALLKDPSLLVDKEAHTAAYPSLNPSAFQTDPDNHIGNDDKGILDEQETLLSEMCTFSTACGHLQNISSSNKEDTHKLSGKEVNGNQLKGKREIYGKDSKRNHYFKGHCSSPGDAIELNNHMGQSPQTAFSLPANCTWKPKWPRATRGPSAENENQALPPKGNLKGQLRESTTRTLPPSQGDFQPLDVPDTPDSSGGLSFESKLVRTCGNPTACTPNHLVSLTNNLIGRRAPTDLQI